jgi:hypothetical protein
VEGAPRHSGVLTVVTAQRPVLSAGVMIALVLILSMSIVGMTATRSRPAQSAGDRAALRRAVNRSFY